MTHLAARILAGPVLAVALAACVVQAAPDGPGLDGPIRVEAGPVPFHTQDPHLDRAGRLRFRGGLALISPDARFGGMSGMRVSADGSRLTAVTDKGHWIEMALRYDATGNLAGVGKARIGALRDPQGRTLSPALPNDAEALARLPAGWLVGFEGEHRFWLYPDGGADGRRSFAIRPRALPQPPGLSGAPANRGIEALAALPDGRLVAIAEGLAAGPGALRGWIAAKAGDGWQPFAWRRTGEFRPSDAAAMPDGALLVLERRFTFAGGFAARLVRVDAGSLRPDALLSGEELGTLDPPYQIDNFEAVATRTGPRGETLIYLLADDNFLALEQNLLFMLELAPAP